MALFDTHAHYDSSRFREDRDAVLSALPAAGVELVVDPGCDLPSSRMAVELAARYPHVYAAVGLHPEDCGGAGEAEFAEIRRLCAEAKVVAVGEIGLDYYWKENPPREFQQAVFRRQIELAIELNLPVIVHDREAHGDCLSIVREYPAARGVFHCFSGSAEMAAELVRRGWYLGFDGPITYPNARKAREAAEIAPLDRIVVETDSPYLSPVPMRGKRNDSRNLPYIVEVLAQWKGVGAAEMERAAWENGKRLFGIG